MRPVGLPLRLFRLTAGFLAVLGLNGHGLAMLLMAFALPTDAAAQHNVPLRIEICTPQGIKALSELDSAVGGDSEKGEFPQPAPKTSGIDSCPVCTAFTQIGSGDLPQNAADPDYFCCKATWQAEVLSSQPGEGSPQAQSRGPPAA